MIIECEKAANQFGVLSVDDTGRITHFEEKPNAPTTVPGQKDMALVSMGVYLVSNEYLASRLREDALSRSSTHDFGKDIIPEGIRRGDNFHAHTFRNPTNEDPPYWRDVGTIDGYYSANIELLKSDPPINLYDADWSTVTHQRQLPPALFNCPNVGANVQSSMISGGCVLGNSQVRKSILFSEVYVENSCELDGVLALAGCRIGANSNLRNVILDNGCIIPEGTTVGYDLRSDAANYHVTEGGTVVINREMLGQSVRYNPEL